MIDPVRLQPCSPAISRCLQRQPTLTESGFGGRVYPVNAAGGEVAGLAAYRDIGAVPETPDFAIITVPANEWVAPIHDRMQAILQNDQFPRWLSEEANPHDLLVPFPEDQLAIKPQPSRR